MKAPKPLLSIRTVSLYMVSCAALFLVVCGDSTQAQSTADSHAPQAADPYNINNLRALFPSQSHAMMDVSYHFTNLWFAGQHANWPLAQFYLNETRNHIKWAIRLVPVRKTSTGSLKLDDIFESFDASKLGAIQTEIAARNRKKFNSAYRDAMQGCNDCHEKADKPYLQVTVPPQPDAHGIAFEPKPEQKK